MIVEQIQVLNDALEGINLPTKYKACGKKPKSPSVKTPFWFVLQADTSHDPNNALHDDTKLHQQEMTQA